MAEPVMTGTTPEITNVRDKYRAEWAAYVKRADARLQLLRTLKRGTELLLLVGAFLLYYLISVLVQVLS